MKVVEAPKAGVCLMKEKILLVEDNKVQKLANERILLKAGYIVFNAADGEDALRVAKEKAPDLILLPIINGQ